MADKGMTQSTPRVEPLDNARHERFANEYCVDFNGSEAYIRAGYSPKGARTSASHLLADPNIIARVQHLVDRRAEKLDFEGERVMLETARLAMSSITDVLEVTDADGVTIFPSETWSDDAKRAVESVKQTETFNKDGELTSRRLELKMHPKQAALSLLSHQIGIIGKGAKNKPLRPEELGVVILPTLNEEPDWDRIEDGDPRYSFVRPPEERD